MNSIKSPQTEGILVIVFLWLLKHVKPNPKAIVLFQWSGLNHSTMQGITRRPASVALLMALGEDSYK